MKKHLAALFIVPLIGASLFLCDQSGKESIDEPQYAKPGMVAYAASYDSVVSNEPQYATQKSKTFDYLSLGNAHSYYRGDSVKVGIIDSGINYDHEDFMVNSSTVVKGDSKYYSYQNSSWIYYKASQHGYSYLDDSLGHGTNVAATVAAAVNGIGGAGIAPNVDLYVYKVTNSSNGYEFGAIQNALMDAVTLGLDVINMSFQSYEHAVSYGTSSMAASSGCSTILSYYLNQAYNAGITLVGAAGNYNTDEPSYPGSNNHVINVGSLAADSTNTKAGFSNYGDTIDLVAPGYVHVANNTSNSSYKDTSGTSFSAPLVTGAIALYIQQNPDATPSEIESALYASCDPINNTNWAGHGALNIEKFLGLDSQSKVDVTGVSLDRHSLTLAPLEGYQLTPTLSPSNATIKTVTYSSSDGDVAMVDETGYILAAEEGQATITVTTDDGGFTDTCVVTVAEESIINPTSISISSSSSTLNVGSTMQFSATVLPNDATDKSVTWSSSNTSVATINSSGVLTGVKGGTTTVTGTTVNGLSNTKTITVNPVLQSISVSGQKTAFEVGDTFSFDGTVTAHYNDSTTADVTSSATFSGYDMSNAGNQTVTVSYGGKTTTYGITVTASGGETTYTVSSTPLTSSNIKNNMLVAWGTSNTNLAYTIESDWVKLTTDSDDWIFFTLKGTSEGFTLEYEGDSVYSSASKKVAFSSTQSTTMTLNANNVVTGNSVGKYVFNTTGLRPYSSGSYTNSYLYEVTSSSDTPSPTLESITISGYTTSFVEGDTFSFGGTVTAHYSDSTTENVTSSATFNGYNMTSTGQQEVTVSYSNRSANYNITVNQGTLSSISISGYTTSYSKGATFSFDGTLTATMENGYQKALPPTSVSSPDMSAEGVKTITISLTYNGKTLSRTYDITVNSQRTVYEEGEVVLGTIAYPSNTQTISNNTISVSTGGYTTIEDNSIRLGSGSNTGAVTVTSTTSNIYKIVVNAKKYGSDTGVTLTIGGTSNTLTSSYDDYEKEYATPTNSVAIATTTNKKRANIQTITLYTIDDKDISSSEDCVGLESFVTTCMHMDYTSNLDYCKDNEHHYYSTAKAAFNALNTHQRSLFTSNSAYALEWARLSAWATANGESLNSSNQLSASNKMRLLSGINNNFVSIIVFVSLTSLTLFGAFKAYRKKDD